MVQSSVQKEKRSKTDITVESKLEDSDGLFGLEGALEMRDGFFGMVNLDFNARDLGAILTTGGASFRSGPSTEMDC